MAGWSETINSFNSFGELIFVIGSNGLRKARSEKENDPLRKFDPETIDLFFYLFFDRDHFINMKWRLKRRRDWEKFAGPKHSQRVQLGFEAVGEPFVDLETSKSPIRQ